ncbi:MAG TPA: basic amino acid ABC transporter substrate-binding protein [Methylomusa anaerophila]|uniref:Glutamine-binding periplasmic protein n=1 Tax=Methylomusa anaerophila TaxID=1930071 RepID=A0A348AKX0_9FIRM|nr:basic amino acid ABC transporter substrate-binding protein [Methylomusa anaerophila]BBB91718.1 glutamine-binding periplasmic protein precursor [Methylomusa anaerophila]HML88545.1 basic amino acid ABC transporter substrate-binding protein [Methylomusa anaerophila]
MTKKTIALIVLTMFLLTLGLAGCGGQQAAKSAEQSAAKTLKVGSDTAFAPFEVQDEKTKEYVGFDMDLIKALGKQMGIPVEVQSMNFDGLIPALEAGNIDMVISAMTITPERAQKVNFSKPYYKSGLSMVVKSDNNTLKSFKDLEGKRIAVQIGTTGADEAKKIKDAKIREFNTAPEAFLELKAGGVDAVVNDLPVNEYYIAQAGGKDAKIVGEPLTSEDYGIATAKKNTELGNKINKALDELKQNGEYEKIYIKWFGKKPPQ